MISLHCDFQSYVLATRVHVDVYLPNIIEFTDSVEDYRKQYTFEPFKTLFLLHGAWDSGQQWVENTSVIRMAEEAGIALVLPSVGNTFYANTKYGVRYEEYFMDELIGFARGLFPLSDKREENFICGVSMGGYGALKTIFKRPDLFSKCAVMSAVVDLSYSARIIRAIGVETDNTIGKWKELKGSEYDLVPMIEALDGRYEELPEIFMIESREDYLRETNEAFHQLLKDKGIRHSYKDYPGMHEWKFWDEHMEECMEFLKK